MSVRKPAPSVLTGEVLPPDPASRRTGAFLGSPTRRVPELPTPNTDSIFPFIARLRADAQSKRYQALEGALRSFEAALRAQRGVAEAIEALELQEERLLPQNLDILKQAARRDVDLRLAEAENRLVGEQQRGAIARLQGELTIAELQRQLAMVQGQPETAQKSEKNIQQQYDDAIDGAAAAQEALAQATTDAERTKHQGRYSACMNRAEKLRQQLEDEL